MRAYGSRLQTVQSMAFCCLALLLGACGVKAPPRPPRQPELPRVQDLQASVGEKGVQLTWSIPPGAKSAAGFNIYRSKPQPDTKECPNCPRGYVLIGTMVEEPGSARLEFVDRDVPGKGRIYYRIVPFDERHRIGPDSNEASVIVE